MDGDWMDRWIKDYDSGERPNNIGQFEIYHACIDEINILTGLKRIQKQDDLDNYRSHIKNFNKQYGNITMTMGISKKLVEQEKKYDDEYHGRYLISEDQEWNITSLDTVGKAQRDDIHKIQNRETFNKDLKNFEDFKHNKT